MDLWVKSLHVIAMIAWMVGFLYLPRLFVYHAAEGVTPETSETFKVMERRLMKAIMTPAMIATWVFGIWIAALYNVWAEPWFIIKLALVLVLTVFHFISVGWMKAFAEDRNEKPQRFFRIANEVPTVLLIVIVILVVVKPF
ncbi:protoporphyrinogen oxidase HemJ [Pseudahrensia aquimaris]|uniref:Protoporphyrinogen IX oxidase n=1 Tax=Pseudahrensia aquimaris TaxID=744461 RepID=A0ABW3FG96_9HYPH